MPPLNYFYSQALTNLVSSCSPGTVTFSLASVSGAYSLLVFVGVCLIPPSTVCIVTKVASCQFVSFYERFLTRDVASLFFWVLTCSRLAVTDTGSSQAIAPQKNQHLLNVILGTKLSKSPKDIVGFPLQHLLLILSAFLCVWICHSFGLLVFSCSMTFLRTLPVTGREKQPLNHFNGFMVSPSPTAKGYVIGALLTCQKGINQFADGRFVCSLQLKEWKTLQEEAAKRDHRKIGRVRPVIKKKRQQENEHLKVIL